MSSARLARVDHDGLADLARQADEAGEDVALHLARRVVVVVVEANLADGHDLGREASARELGVRGVVELDGVVRVDADARRDALRARAASATAPRAGVRSPPRRRRRSPRRPAACARAITSRPLGEVAGVEVAVGVGKGEHGAMRLG